VRERIPFIWKEKLLRSKRRRDSLEIIGMYCLAKNYILTNVKGSQNTKICKV
jgi:hypothetical protein